MYLGSKTLVLLLVSAGSECNMCTNEHAKTNKSVLRYFTPNNILNIDI